MSCYKRTTTITGKYKELCVQGGKFVDPDSGEVVNLADELTAVYGENIPFSLQTSAKSESDIALGGDE